MKILMHVCCAPDATTAYLRLRKKGEITFFYYNPNIHPPSEYKRRLDAVEKLAHLWKVPLIIGDYDVKAWYESIKGHEHGGEGSIRCLLCMKHRLNVTAMKAKELGFDAFSTSLATSPNKIYEMIVEAGEEASSMTGLPFVIENFRKNGGYPLSVKLSKELRLYRQDYCGCIFSLKEIREKRRISKERRREELARVLKELKLEMNLELDPERFRLEGKLLELPDEILERILVLLRPRRVLVEEGIAMKRWKGRRNLRFGRYKVRLEMVKEGREPTLFTS